MQFESEQSTYEFYNMYERRMIFSIRKDTIEKNRYTGEITLKIFVYSKESYITNRRRFFNIFSIIIISN